MCEEFILTKWTRELIKNRLKFQYGIPDNNQLNQIVDMVQEVIKGNKLYHSENDFPPNTEELGKLWILGYTNGLNVGDRVQFKYILNVDSADTEQKLMLRCCQDEFGTVIGFKKCERSDIGVYSGFCQYILVDFDNKVLNEIKVELLPMQFIKHVRGLRAKTNVIDEVCNINKEKIGETLSTYMGTCKEKKNVVKPIDFKSLIDREKDKKKIIYGLFDSILDVNLEGIKSIVEDNYTVEIIYKIGSANVLCIRDDRTIGERCCYIKYENINTHKTFQELTKEEIEEYLQRIVIGFIMEYDK